MTDNGAVPDAGASDLRATCAAEGDGPNAAIRSPSEAAPVSAQPVIAPAVCAVCPRCGEDVLHYCSDDTMSTLAECAAEIERLHDPSVKCGRGHSPGLPIVLWDCPDCTAQLRVELAAETAAADIVRRSNAAMLEEIDRWREDADQLAAVVESNRKCHGCGMLCRVCSDAYAAALIAHDALAKEAGE